MEVGVSVVVPVKNESENIAPLLAEIVGALEPRGPFEIVYVDDGSSDDTAEVLGRMRAQYPQLRALRHAESCGQSAAIRTGVEAARGHLIVTLDGDGQNDPADIPLLLETFDQATHAPGELAAVGLVAGQRRERHDSLVKRLASLSANRIRRWVLNDATEDTGCGLKLIPRDLFLALPFFDHMHRFLPALVRREGYRVAFVGVRHRPRQHGQSNYGVLDRALVSISDLLGVVWLIRRRRRPQLLQEL